MIKKIILILLVALLGFGIYVAVMEGIPLSLSFGNVKVSGIKSYKQLVEYNEDLDEAIDDVEEQKIEFEKAENNLKKMQTAYNENKLLYDQLASTASKEAIAEANQREEYLLDYLWIKIGNYANDNNVKCKLTDDSIGATLTFDVTGEYISIINFIYDIENDTELSFKVDNVIAEGGMATDTKAKFIVTGVNIITSET